MVAISLLLGVAIAGTGFISARWRQEKTSLGQAHYERGQALMTRGDASDSIEEFRKALIFSPDTAEYRLSFASALVKEGRLDEAQSHVEQLLEEDPTNGEFNLMLGRIAAQRKEAAKAIEYYQRAVYEYWAPQRVTERRQARLELIDLLAKSGRHDELVAELMTLHANFPADHALTTHISFELLDHGATADAIEMFRDLIRASPKDGEAHRGLAQSYFSAGDYISARHEFERALHLNAKDEISANELKLTNAVVDLDPDLQGIHEAERLRRAQNLLRRVVSDVGGCAAPSAAGDELAKANQLLTAKPGSSEDLALTWQNEAVALWSQRTRWCTGNPTDDSALATVLARITSE